MGQQYGLGGSFTLRLGNLVVNAEAFLDLIIGSTDGEQGGPDQGRSTLFLDLLIVPLCTTADQSADPADHRHNAKRDQDEHKGGPGRSDFSSADVRTGIESELAKLRAQITHWTGRLDRAELAVQVAEAVQGVHQEWEAHADELAREANPSDKGRFHATHQARAGAKRGLEEQEAAWAMAVAKLLNLAAEARPHLDTLHAMSVKLTRSASELTASMSENASDGDDEHIEALRLARQLDELVRTAEDDAAKLLGRVLALLDDEQQQ